MSSNLKEKFSYKRSFRESFDSDIALDGGCDNKQFIHFPARFPSSNVDTTSLAPTR